MGGGNKIKVLPATVQLGDLYKHSSLGNPRIVDLNGVRTRPWVGELASDKLNEENTAGEDVELLGVLWRICEGLGRHVTIGSGTVGGGEVRVASQ